MSSNIYTQAGKNTRRTWFLMTVFFVLIILIGYVFAQIYESTAILFFAIIFSLILNFTSYWYSDKIVLHMHSAKPATREEYFDLYTVTENMAITAGLPMPRLFVVDDPSPNAFATGRDKEHAVVCVTSGLLPLMNRQELEGVIAHEISHIGNRDILLSTTVVVLAGFIAMLSHIFLRTMRFGGRNRDDGQAGAIFLVVGIVLAILAPISATLIQLAISRKREYLADADGVLLTRYPEGLASALRKIGEVAMPMKTANTATAHLFISNPFGQANTIGSRISNLFQDHPPIPDRIRALLGKNAKV